MDFFFFLLLPYYFLFILPSNNRSKTSFFDFDKNFKTLQKQETQNIAQRLKRLSCLQVSHTNPVRALNQRIPPAVPVRIRESSSTDEESTQNSTAITPAQNSTIAQHSHHIQTNPFLPDSNYGQKDTYIYGKNNPFVEQNISGAIIKMVEPYGSDKTTSKPEQGKHHADSLYYMGEVNPKVNLPTPPPIPPPPVRSRRASACLQTHENLLDPRNPALNQRRSSSPFQNYSGVVENDLLKNYLKTNTLIDSPYNSHNQIDSLHNSQKQLNTLQSNTILAHVKEPEEGNSSLKEGNKNCSLVSQPTIILPNNYQELQRQATLTKENSQKNKISQFKMQSNTFTSNTTVGGKSNSQKPLLHRSTTESSESGIGSSSNGVFGDKSPPSSSKMSMRQDSNVSSDSVSQTSSPSYTTKTMETPLLQHHNRKVIHFCLLFMKIIRPTDMFQR